MFELLRRVWGPGYATEAAWAVLDWARSSGYERLWATVWDWNTASRRVLAKLGFTETDQKEVDSAPWGHVVHHETALTGRAYVHGAVQGSVPLSWCAYAHHHQIRTPDHGGMPPPRMAKIVEAGRKVGR